MGLEQESNNPDEPGYSVDPNIISTIQKVSTRFGIDILGNIAENVGENLETAISLVLDASAGIGHAGLLLGRTANDTFDDVGATALSPIGGTALKPQAQIAANASFVEAGLELQKGIDLGKIAVDKAEDIYQEYKDLGKFYLKGLTATGEGNSTELATSLGTPLAMYHPEAHHIVPSGMVYGTRGILATIARGLLVEAGVDINSTENGVWLSENIHRKSHTTENMAILVKSLYDGFKKSGSDGIISALSDQKNSLTNGGTYVLK